MQPFDPLAAIYDDTFTHTQIGSYLRTRVHARLDAHFHPGNQILELGCGTGEDALYLDQRGIQITATDVSSTMLEIAQAKTKANPQVQVIELDLNQLPELGWDATFDGAFSNFGPLNCVDELPQLAAWLAARINPGGIVAFGVMSPFCIWEPLWHGLHGDFNTATRRWRKNITFQPTPDTAPISIHYPTIRQITRDFAPYFRRTHVEGLGLFLPPSDVSGVIEKRARLMNNLLRLEDYFARRRPLASLADHYWIEFEHR